MATEGTKQKLAAIISADVKDYSRLLSQDRVGTIKTLNDHREMLSSSIQQYGGRVVDMPGDNILAVIESVSDAVNCAVEIQRELAERNAEVPSARMMHWRIGVNLGDIVEEEGKVYGDGVNIAARVEKLAEPGGICVSGRVYDQIHGKLGLEYESLGEQTVKNIADPIRIYRVLSYPGAAAHRVVKAKSDVAKRWRNLALGAIGVAVIFVGAMMVWNHMSQPGAPSSEVVEPETPITPTEKPVIAVLPFDNLSGDPEQEYFADGMVDELITKLSMNHLLTVIARSSSFFYKGKQVKIQQIGQELGAGYVVEGSVRKSGSKIRITFQLIDATKEGHIWAETLERELKDLFLLQDEIAERIAVSLGIKTVGAETERAKRIATKDMTAYDLWLKGMHHYHTLATDQETSLKAMEMFRRAVDIDPDFAPAYVGIASVYLERYIWGWDANPQNLERALGNARKALSLESSYPMARWTLAQAYRFKGQMDDALAETDRAIKISPSAHMAFVLKGVLLRVLGRPEEGVTAIKRAMQLNPHYDAWYAAELSGIYHDLGRLDEALAAAKEAVSLNPDFMMSPTSLAYSYLYLGRYDDAIKTLQEALDQHPDWANLYGDLFNTHKYAGRYEEAIALASEMVIENPNWVNGYYEITRSMLASWYSQQNNDPNILDKALRSAQKSTTIDSELPWGPWALFHASLARKEHEKAISEAEKLLASASDPAIINGRLMLAAANYFLGEPDEAIRIFEGWFQDNPQRPEDMLNILGLSYIQTGRLENARATLEGILAPPTNHLDELNAHLALAILQAKSGQEEKSRAEAKEVLRLSPGFSVEAYGQRMPYRDPGQAERDMASLRKAGLK